MPRGLVPPRTRERFVVRADCNWVEGLQTAGGTAATALALMAARAGIGAAEGMAAGTALSFIPSMAHDALRGGLYFEACVVFIPPLCAAMVGTGIGALLPSSDLLHVAKIGAEGAGIVAGAGLLGVVLGCIAYKANYAGRDAKTDRIGMGGHAFFGGWIGGLAGTLAGVAYVVKNCL